MFAELFYTKELKELVAKLREEGMLDEKAWNKFQKRFSWQVVNGPTIFILIALLGFLGRENLPVFNVAGIGMAIWFSIHSIKWMNQSAILYTKGIPILANLTKNQEKNYFFISQFLIKYQFNDKSGNVIESKIYRIGSLANKLVMGMKFVEDKNCKQLKILYDSSVPEKNYFYSSFFSNLFCLTKDKERLNV